MLCDEFSDAVEHVTENAELMIDCGREIMDMPEQSGAALMWRGFYLGFGKGCEFMAEGGENVGQ